MGTTTSSDWRPGSATVTVADSALLDEALRRSKGVRDEAVGPYEEGELLNDLPRSLKEEVLYYEHGSLVESI